MHKNLSSFRKSSFCAAFFLLPKDKRHDLSLIYSFARIVDDIADDKFSDNNQKKGLLNLWKEKIEKIFSGMYEDPFSEELGKVIKKYCLKRENFLDLIDGALMDTDVVEYRTFESLKRYMYKIAVIPGILTLDILEYKETDRYELAENLGYAVQLTNIIRDVYIDAQDKRFYIPEEDLRKFNVDKKMLINKEISSNFLALMNFEYNRACDYYKNSQKYFTADRKKILKVPMAMSDIYFQLLNQIKKKNFDTRKKIPKINSMTKLKIFLKFTF